MTPDEMLEFMPHRGRNVLIDAFEDAPDGGGVGRLSISPGDPAGRDLFLVDGPAGQVVSPFFLVEHAALASLLVIREEMGSGRLAYFSKVSKFERRGDAPAGAALVSTLTRGRDRGDFRAFHAEVATESGAPVLGVDFMAFLLPRGERPVAPETGSAAPLPARAELFPGFPPALAFLGGPDLDRAVYPPDHPLAEGHFPGSPTMMGMTQWLAVAQRAALTAPGGASEVRGSGGLTTFDGTPVVDVAGLALRVTRDGEGRVTELVLLATKRVAFRERIMAGEGYVATFDPD